MTTQPNRDQLRALVLSQNGRPAIDPQWPSRALSLLNQLDQAEAEKEELSVALTFALTGEEVQTEERHSNAVALAQAVIRADRAEARIQAVRDVLDKHVSIFGDDALVPGDRIRRALEDPKENV